MPKPDSKRERLRIAGMLNPNPQQVRAPWFQSGGFFDPHDLIQTKYEMLRHVQVGGASKAEAANLFGMSRPTFYQAEAAFAREGLAPQRSRNRTHFCSRERTRRVRRLFHQRGSKGEMVRCGMNPLWSVAEQRIHPARGRTGDDVPHQRGGLAWRARQAL